MDETLGSQSKQRNPEEGNKNREMEGKIEAKEEEGGEECLFTQRTHQEMLKTCFHS